MDVANVVAIVGVAVSLVIGGTALWLAYGPHQRARRERDVDRFVEVRQHLDRSRPDLARIAARVHPELNDGLLAGMLTRPAWVAPQPIDIGAIAMHQIDEPPAVADRSFAKIARRQLPGPYATYTQAMSGIPSVTPTLFTDDPCYRILDVDLAGPTPQMTFGLTSYFRSLDVFEAIAHEIAAVDLRRRGRPAKARHLVIRRAAGDLRVWSRRPTLMAIGALTVRVAPDGSARYLLHDRDAEAVATGGDVLDVAPGGVFQPTGVTEEVLRRDLDGWFGLNREYAEEFLDVPEARAARSALPYETEEPYRSLHAAYLAGEVRVHVIGLGLDPVSMFPNLVCVAVWQAAAFDRLFGRVAPIHEEGTLRGEALVQGGVVGFPLTRAGVDRMLGDTRLAPAAQAALSRLIADPAAFGITRW